MRFAATFLSLLIFFSRIAQCTKECRPQLVVLSVAPFLHQPPNSAVLVWCWVFCLERRVVIKLTSCWVRCWQAPHARVGSSAFFFAFLNHVKVLLKEQNWFFFWFWAQLQRKSQLAGKADTQKLRIELFKWNSVDGSKTAGCSSVVDTVSMSSGAVLATLTTHLAARGRYRCY